ncbi:CHAT domain-containing protein [Saprospiraceae bacterium]|nr:CHAT domain-containing protein [Saprospiraceae bacterium]
MRIILLFLILTFGLITSCKNSDHTSIEPTLQYNVDQAKEMVQLADSLITLESYNDAILNLTNAENILTIKNDTLSQEYADLFHLKAYAYRKLDSLYLAISNFNSSITLRSSMYGSLSLPVAKSSFYLGDCYIETGQLALSIEPLLCALTVFKDSLDNNIDILSYLYNRLANSYGHIGDFSKAIQYCDSTLSIIERQSGPNSQQYAIQSDNMGIWHRNLGDWKMGFEFHKKALNIIEQQVQDSLTKMTIANIYNNMAMCIEINGDEEKSLSYYQKALSIREKIADQNSLLVATSLENIAMNSFFNKEPDSVIHYLNKVLSIREKHPEKKPDLAVSHQNIGHYYTEINDFELAAKHANKALAIKKEIYPTSHPSIGLSLNNLADIYEKQGQDFKAKEYYEKAEKIWQNQSESRALVLYNLGEINAKLNKPGKAKDLYLESNKLNNYISNELDQIISIPVLINSLGALADLEYSEFHQNNNIKSLKNSLDLFLEAEDVLNFYRKSIIENKSNVITKDITIYEGVIRSEYLIDSISNSIEHAKNAFRSCESSHALNLYQAFKNSKALKFGGIPDSLIDKEYNLKVKIAYFEKRIFELDELKTKNSSTNGDEIRSVLFDLKREQENLELKLKEEFPAYYKLKYDNRITTIDEIQKTLKHGQCVLEYFVGEQDIYIFGIKHDAFQINRIQKNFPLNNYIDSLRFGIKETRYIPSKQYVGAATKLYHKLVSPMSSFIDGSFELIIIPDGKLGYVPFDALLLDNPTDFENFQTYPYLLNEFQICYNYSATLLLELNNKTTSSSALKNYLGVAPIFLNDHNQDQKSGVTLNPLRYNVQEVKNAQKLFGGNILVGKNATEEEFSNIAHQFRIIHLSTHGKANDRKGDYSYLAFSEGNSSNLENQLLYNREIYNLKLNADMVILSACETGIGELQTGEGIISLSRGFTYAGAKSIMTTLWMIEEKSSMDLLDSFYQYIKQGKRKDEALNLAKNNIIKKGEFSSPYYWAAFIPIGAMESLSF